MKCTVVLCWYNVEPHSMTSSDRMIKYSYVRFQTQLVQIAYLSPQEVNRLEFDQIQMVSLFFDCASPFVCCAGMPHDAYFCPPSQDISLLSIKVVPRDGLATL